MSKENLRTPDKIFIEDTISILERNMSDSIKITCLKIAYTNYLTRKEKKMKYEELILKMAIENKSIEKILVDFDPTNKKVIEDKRKQIKKEEDNK